MKKRVLALLLAAVLLINSVPMAVFAEDAPASVDVSPAETPIIPNTEPEAGSGAVVMSEEEPVVESEPQPEPCKTCGEVGCESGHESWCETCKKDNCGVDHTAVVEPCAICKQENCTVKHEKCDTCGEYDCTVEHVYCKACLRWDCGKDHTRSVKAEDVVGHVATIKSGTLMLWTMPFDTNNQKVAGASLLPAYVRVVSVHTHGESTILYELKAADGSAWPSFYEGFNYVSSEYVNFVENYCEVCHTADCGKTHVWCATCKKYDCGVNHNVPATGCGCCDHCLGGETSKCCEDCTCFVEPEIPTTSCEVCGEKGCTAVHFFCEYCEDYDCGESHIFCPACGELDCEETHVFCSKCGDYDCGLTHIDTYKPATAPQIPVEPTLTPGADISLVDGDGDPITSNGLTLRAGEKLSLSAWAETGNATSYRWQVGYYDGELRWVYIKGETDKGILVSPAMFLSLMDEFGEVYLRCVAKVDGKEKASQTIPVSVMETMSGRRKLLSSGHALSLLGETAAQSENEYTITIKYLYSGSNEQAASPSVARVTAGQSYTLDIPAPIVPGYVQDSNSGFVKDGNTARIYKEYGVLSGNQEINIYYVPDKVNVRFVHQWQNADGGAYTVRETETKKLLTKSYVGAGHENTYEGYYALRYDELLEVAADGSTVVNIYYDRVYYLVNLNLNGGYGVDPIYARHGVSINTAAMIPQRTGYTFDRWEPALPTAVPMGGSEHEAKWITSGTGFSVVFWYENANDDNYTFVGSLPQTGLTGSFVNGASYKDKQYDGYNADYAKHFEYSHADSNVEIKADGMSAVNVYFARKSYTLTYYKYQCLHTSHTSACYKDVQICGKTEHTHTHEQCCSNQSGFLHFTHGYSACPYKDQGGEHTHSTSCYEKTLACPHKTGYNCGCDNTADARWKTVYTATFKFEQDVSAVHAAQGAERWCPGRCEGLKDSNGNYYADYGASPAHGVYSSMGGGDVKFYQGNTGSVEYKLTYWLETYDGSGSRNYNGKNFAQGTTFSPKMGAVGYWGDYVPGCPVGFHEYEAWTSPSLAGNNDKQLKVGDQFGGNTYIYYNFYYVRNEVRLLYYNGSECVAERRLKYDQPLTSENNLMDLLGPEYSPYGAGYEFDRWYLDDEFAVPVDWGTTRMPDGDMAVYAKWKPVEHTVRTYLNETAVGAVNPEGGLLNTYTVLHGNTVPENARPKNPELPATGMTFVSWFYRDENGEEKAYNFSMPVNRDMDLYAGWNGGEMVYGTVYYKLTDGTEIAKSTDIGGQVGTTKTYTAKFGNELYAGYTSGYFPTFASTNVPFTTDGDNSVTFWYEKMPNVPYTIEYYFNGVRDDSKTKTGTSDKGTITHDADYFDGFSVDALSKTLVLSTVGQNNVLRFYYTTDTVHAPVRVIHKLQNTDNDEYSVAYSSDYSGVIGEEQTITADEFVGFTYNAEKSAGTGNNGATLGKQGLTITLFYDRIEYPYAFRFVTTVNGAEQELVTAVTGSARYGATVKQDAASIPGYRLLSAARQEIMIAVENPADTAKNNVTTFVYTENTVAVDYRVVSLGSGEGGSLTNYGGYVMAKTGAVMPSTAKASTGYEFKGWYSDATCAERFKITDDTTVTHVKNGYGVWEEKTYYALFDPIPYQAKFEPNGGSVSSTGKMFDIEDELQLPMPARKGYTFNGWKVTKASGNWTSGWQYSAYDTSIAAGKYGDVTFTAQWTENTCNIVYQVFEHVLLPAGGSQVKLGEGGTPAKLVEETIGVATDEPAGATAVPATGYQFEGWYISTTSNPSGLNDVVRISTSEYFTPGQTDGLFVGETYYAVFAPIQYSISYDLVDGSLGEGVTNPAYYTVVSNDITLNNPTKKGYEFLGWTGSNGEMPQTTVTIPKGSIENRTYTANWKLIEYTIEYTGLEGSVVIGNPDKYTVETVDFTLNNPTKPGYKFLGWQGTDLTAPVQTVTVKKGSIGDRTYTAVFELALVDLTITATGESEPHSYIFDVVGTPYDTSFGTLQMQVVLTEEKTSITIKGLPVGNYTVTEKDGWSWRQRGLGAKTVTLDDPAGHTVEFAFGGIENRFWLNGYSYNKKRKTAGN